MKIGKRGKGGKGKTGRSWALFVVFTSINCFPFLPFPLFPNRVRPTRHSAEVFRSLVRKQASRRRGDPPVEFTVEVRDFYFASLFPSADPSAFFCSASTARRLSLTRSCSSTAMTFTSISSPTLQTSPTLAT